MGKKVIFLDRDGILVEPIKLEKMKERAPIAIGEYEPIIEAKPIVKLLSNKFKIFVITNQPDFTKQKLDLKNLNEINNQVLIDFPQINKIYCCTHTIEENCICRKPKTGLLERAISENKLYGIEKWMVGDRWVDILAGSNFNCATVLLRRDISWLPSGGMHAPKNLKPHYEIKRISELEKIVLA